MLIPQLLPPHGPPVKQILITYGFLTLFLPYFSILFFFDMSQIIRPTVTKIDPTPTIIIYIYQKFIKYILFLYILYEILLWYNIFELFIHQFCQQIQQFFVYFLQLFKLCNIFVILIQNLSMFGVNPQKTGMNTSQYDFKGVAAKPPPSSYKPTASRAGGNVGTASGRPVSNRGMNFSNDLQKKAKQLEGTKYKEQLNKKNMNNPEQNFKKIEKEINTLLEESTNLKIEGNYSQALQKAKQIVTKQKNLRKQRQTGNMADLINHDLSFAISLNHALCLEANGMLQQALAKYNELIKGKQYQFAGRIRVNMGNIYYNQQKYSAAIRMYKMALDILPATSKQMRFKITKNIGHAYVRMGEFQNGISSYEHVLKGTPDHKTAYNLIICLYATGDKLRMKDCFTSMIKNTLQEEQQQAENAQGDDVIRKNDKLKQESKARRKDQIRMIISSAKLIAPVIQNDVITAYDWILENLKTSSYPEVESEVQIFKAMAYLKKKQIQKAIETLKGLQKKDKTTMSRVASNISFLYFLERNYNDAEKYVDIAINHDRYNARALVNKGNCLFMKNDFRRAKEHYLEAIGVQADCVEALYNLGYVNKKLNNFMEALQALQKIQTVISIPETIFQIAHINQIIGRTKQALKWYQIILTKLPNDAGVLARVGNIFFREDDEQQALHYYLESYRLLPTNIDTNTWLGIYYVKQSMYEKACFYLERASQIQPKQVKWRLMVASCQRRIGNFQKALKIYQAIYQEYPDNLQCLRFLVLLCKDMGLDYEQYAKELNRIELQNEARGEYQNNDLRNINQQQQQPAQNNEEPINIKTDNRRRQAVKPKKQEKDQWGDDIEDDLGL